MTLNTASKIEIISKEMQRKDAGLVLMISSMVYRRNSIGYERSDLPSAKVPYPHI